MIGKTSILRNLQRLEALYSSAHSPMKTLFYAKLSILELGGWIEESMDSVIRSCANRNLKDGRNRHVIEEDIIKRTYGFAYDQHFRKMLVQVVGLAGVEKLEKRVDPVKLHMMKGALGSLKTSRDTEAHSHLKGVTRRLDAPSVTRARFFDVYDGLREVESTLRKLTL